MGTERFLKWATPVAVLAAVLAVVSFGLVVINEATARGATQAMATTTSDVAGMLSLLAAMALLVSIVALFVRTGTKLSLAGGGAFLVVLLGAALTTASMGTLALVVPHLAEKAPHIALNPPALVPAAFILSGFIMSIGGIAWAIALRRTDLFPRWQTTFLIVGSVICMAPLPARFFVFAAASAALLSSRLDAPARVETSALSPASI